MKLDAIDRRLLDMLQLDCDTPVAELAAAVQLSTTPCWRRIQRMKEAGVITSTSRLDLVTSGGQIVMRGESGFMFSMETSALIVSNRVRTVIHNAGLKGMKP